MTKAKGAKLQTDRYRDRFVNKQTNRKPRYRSIQTELETFNKRLLDKYEYSYIDRQTISQVDIQNLYHQSYDIAIKEKNNINQTARNTGRQTDE